MIRAKYVGQVAVLAGVYFLVAHCSLSVASLKENVSAVWPPTGIAMAALLLSGRRLWPGVFIGAFLANGTGSLRLAVAVGMAVGNTLEAVVGVSLLRRRRDVDLSFLRNSDLLAWVGQNSPTQCSNPPGTASALSTGLT